MNSEGTNAEQEIVDHRLRRLTPLGEACVAAASVMAIHVALHPDAVAMLGRLYDDGVYLVLGKAIASGEGYRSIHLVGAPVHVKVPPLLPALYALFWLSGRSLNAVTQMALVASLAATTTASGLLWYYARTVLRTGRILTAVFVIGPLLTQPVLFYFSGATSEPWMLLGWIGALVLVERIRRDREMRGVVPVRLALALGAVLAATSLARTQGAAIAAGILVCLPLMRLGWRANLAAAVATFAPLGAWGLWHATMAARGPLSTVSDQTSYLAWIPTRSVGELIDFVLLMCYRNVPFYLRAYGPLLVGWGSRKTHALAAVVVVLTCAGLVLMVRRVPALVATVVAAVAAILVWPYFQDRFLAPIAPMAGLAAAYAAHRGVTHLPRIARATALTLATVIASYALFLNLHGRHDDAVNAPQGRFARESLAMASWIRANTRPDERIMLNWGAVIFLRTGRRTSIADPEEALFGPTLLDIPHRYYAQRLLADSVDLVMLWDYAPGRSHGLLRALGVRCPGVLTPVPADVASALPPSVHFYRVRRDLPCLTAVARNRTDAWPPKHADEPAIRTPR